MGWSDTNAVDRPPSFIADGELYVRDERERADAKLYVRRNRPIVAHSPSPGAQPPFIFCDEGLVFKQRRLLENIVHVYPHHLHTGVERPPHVPFELIANTDRPFVSFLL